MVAQFVHVQFLGFNISFDLAAVLHRELNNILQDYYYHYLLTHGNRTV